MRGLLASPLGFLIGRSLGGLGAGGSILAVPALVYGAGQSPHEATATSLVLVGAAALVGVRPHLQSGRVRLGTGLAFAAAGVPGSVAGATVNRHVDPNALLLAFAALMILAAWRMLTGCPTCTKVGEDSALAPGGVALSVRVDTRRFVVVGGAGVAVGFLTGLLGVGGGFVVVPALALLLHLPMPQAIGTSLVVIAANAAVALAARVGTATIDWQVTVPFAASAVAGVLAGARSGGRLDPRQSLRWFAVVLVAVALWTAADALIG